MLLYTYTCMYFIRQITRSSAPCVLPLTDLATPPGPAHEASLPCVPLQSRCSKTITQFIFIHSILIQAKP